MKWEVCIGMRPAPGMYEVGRCMRLVITNGSDEIVCYRWTPLWFAQARARRLNGKAGALRSVADVRAERKQYDAAMREMGIQ